MDLITKIFDFNFADIMPDIAVVLEKTQFLIRLAVLAGPIVLLVLGLIYFFIPPGEANHRFGFRTYFGMGSVEAWRFTQKAAGSAFGGLGLILLIVMLVVTSGFDAMSQFDMVNIAVQCLLWQVALALLARLAVMLLATVRFDRHGNRRGK